MKTTITQVIKPVLFSAALVAASMYSNAQAPPLVSTVSGKVWVERDGVPADGIQNSGEGNLSGILVRMITGSGSGPGATTVAVGMTDASGNYTLQNYHGTGNFTIRFDYPNQAFAGVSPVGGSSQSHVVNTTATAPIAVASSGDNKTINMGLVRNLSYIVNCGMYAGTTEWTQNVALQPFDYAAAGVVVNDLNLWNAAYSNHDHITITENSAPGTQMPVNMDLSVGIRATATYPYYPTDTMISEPLTTPRITGSFSVGETKHYYNRNAARVLPSIDVSYLLSEGTGTVNIPMNVNGQATFTGSTNFIVDLPTTAGFGGCLVYQLASPLAVSLVSLNVNIDKGMPKLEWKTSAEKDSKGFDVEHSTDGKNWMSIGFVSSKGDNGNSVEDLSYDFYHRTAPAGKNFYRLNQVDHDGTSSLSKVVSVTIGSSSDVRIYPNVVEQSGAKVNIDGLSGNSEISVFDLNGTRVAYFSSIKNAEIIDMSAVPVGLYNIVVKDFETSTVKTAKIIKR